MYQDILQHFLLIAMSISSLTCHSDCGGARDKVQVTLHPVGSGTVTGIGYMEDMPNAVIMR